MNDSKVVSNTTKHRPQSLLAQMNERASSLIKQSDTYNAIFCLSGETSMIGQTKRHKKHKKQSVDGNEETREPVASIVSGGILFNSEKGPLLYSDDSMKRLAGNDSLRY